jgi:glucokinase
LAVLGIDLGGTKTAGIVFHAGEVVERYRATTDITSSETVMAGIVEACSRLLEAARSNGLEVESIGLGIAGFIDFERGVVTDAPNHPLYDAPVRDILQDAFHLPVIVDNDANVAALAEARLGAGKGCRYLVHLTLGTGIGGGIIVDGEVYRGAQGAGAELGHMIIDENGPVCNCGARGCLEALASGVAIYKRVEELSWTKKRSPMLDEFRADPLAFRAEAVERHASDGDESALSILRAAGKHLGVGIASLINIFNPDAVTLSGGLLGCFRFMEEEMRMTVDGMAIPISRRHVRILTSTLGDDGGTLGAALLASEHG